LRRIKLAVRTSMSWRPPQPHRPLERPWRHQASAGQWRAPGKGPKLTRPWRNAFKQVFFRTSMNPSRRHRRGRSRRWRERCVHVASSRPSC